MAREVPEERQNLFQLNNQSPTVCTVLYRVLIKYMRFRCVARQISKNNFSFEGFLETPVGSSLMLYLFVISWKGNVDLKNSVSDRSSFTIKRKAVGRLLVRKCTPKFFPPAKGMNSLAILLFNDIVQFH